MSDEKKSGASELQVSEKDTEILIEKVREIEAAKHEREAVEAKNLEAKKLEKENTSEILGEKMEYTPVMSDEEAKKNMARRSRRGFLIGGASAIAGIFGYRWLRQPEQNWIYHRAFEFNESVSQLYYSPARLAPEFARTRIGNLRVNGGEGMSEGFDPSAWRLQVVGLANPQSFPQYTDNIAYETAMDNNSEMQMTNQLHENQDAKTAPNAPMPPPATMDRAAAPQMPMPGLLLTLDDIKSLPRVEMTTELKCIEGWSTIVNWAGARFSDFIAQFLPATRNGSQPDLNRAADFVRYVSMVTPDGGYYVGMDMPSILHPQTLLAYEMNGAPLPLPHGAPLRLVTPTKYGIKQIKRIGRISFTDERPADYWGERGYDWYSGH
jgi:hypothetical protein